MKFNPSGKFFVTCSAHGVFEVYDTRDWASLFKVQATERIWETPSNIPSLAWLDDTRLAILGPATPNSIVNCWQFDESRATSPFLRLVGHEGLINDIQYDISTGIIATASDDLSVRLWKTDKPTPYHEFRNHMSSVRAISFQPQTELDTTAPRVLASASFDGTISLYDLSNFTLLHLIGSQIHNFPHDRISCISWSPDGKYLCSGDLEGTVGIWEWRGTTEPRAFAIWAPERIREDQQDSLPNGMNGHKDELDRPVHRIHWQKNGQSFAVCRENRRV
jgi:WD40 repeat protein